MTSTPRTTPSDAPPGTATAADVATAADAADAVAPAQAGPPLRVGLILTSLVLAIVPVQLDGLVAATAAPTIALDLGGFSALAWIATAYLLTTAVGTIVAGRLGDLFGRKALLVAALLVFLAGSLWAGLSTAMGELIAARGLQGLGAGMTLTTLLAVVADIAPPDKRARYSAVLGAVAPVSMLLGPWVGGIVTEHLGWRWIFLLNVPLIALALVGALTLVHLPATRRTGRVDVAGLVLLSVASTGIVLGVTWGGHEHPWLSWQVLGAFAVAVAAVVALVPVERRADQPVLPPALLRNRAVVASLVVMALGTGAVLMGSMNFLPLYLQLVQGRSASSSGLLLLPLLLPALAVAIGAGSWTTRPSRFRPAMVLGTVVLAGACALLATMDVGTPAAVTACWMVLAGAGLGLLFQTPLVLVQNSAPADEVGAATGAAQFLRMLGGAVGVGALGTVFTGTVTNHLGSSSADVGALTLDQVRALPAAAQDVVRAAVAAGSSAMFWVAAAVAAGATAAALLVPRVRDGAADLLPHPAGTADAGVEDGAPAPVGQGAGK